MSEDDLVSRAQWGNLDGQNWVVLVRLSTDEGGDESTTEPAEGERRRSPMTGRDIKSTKEQERDARHYIGRHGGTCVQFYYEPGTSAWREKRVPATHGRPADLRAEWDGLTLPEQRAYIEQTLTAVLVSPAVGLRRPVQTRLTPLFRAEDDTYGPGKG